MNTRRRLLGLLSISLIAFTACTKREGGSTGSASPGAFQVGLVLDRGGKDDKSFNAAAYKGASEAESQLKIHLKYVEATDDNAFEPMLRSFAQKDYDLIIGIGIAQAEAVKKIAQQFPNKNFAIVDSEVQLPNVRSLLFQEHEGSFLVGVMAGLASKSGKVGFIGGMDIPLIRRFEMGYAAGAKHVNAKAQVISNYVGVTSEAWHNPAKAKELAIAQFQSGAEVVFGAAGASGTGLFDAAEERKKLAIGVDSNQNWIKPGFVLTSMLKRVDVAVFDAIKDAQDAKSGTKKFETGVKRFGLSNQGIDYSMDEHNAKLVSAEMKQKVDAVKAEIIAGKITVPDYYLQKQ